jgi:hypothetical protein
MVLISFHINGTQSLNSPYKMIAADANKSNTITTLDIVEIRKLILGIYTEFPDNTSWRFVPKSFVFPNPQNPFVTIFPEKITLSSSMQNQDFVAIKVGDVNNSASGGNIISKNDVLIGMGQPLSSGDNIITLPIKYTDIRPSTAIQMGLRFDPDKFELIGPSKGSVPGFSLDNFNLTKAAMGEIRTLWIPAPTEPERILQMGDVMFYLTFKIKQQGIGLEDILHMDDQLLENKAWLEDHTEYHLDEDGVTTKEQKNTAIASEKKFEVLCSPNPVKESAALLINSKAVSGKAMIWVFDATGRKFAMRETNVIAGEPTRVDLPELNGHAPGVYLWKVVLASQRAEGMLIKE